VTSTPFSPSPLVEKGLGNEVKKQLMKKILLILKQWWMKFAHVVGWFNTRLLLTLVYVILFAIPAIVLKLIRKDLLDRKFSNTASYWKEKEKGIHTIEQAKHQF
jgi:hypothetical protein